MSVRKIAEVDLTEQELAGIRSMLSDAFVTAMYVQTESDWLPPTPCEANAGGRLIATLVDTRIDSTGNPNTQDRLAGAFEQIDRYQRRLELELEEIDRARLATAFDRIGHKSSPTFQARLANAYDEVV
jgi:hypothetical protein